MVSEPKVLQSAAGFYVGHTYANYDEDGKFLYSEPYDRVSGYFPTKEDAQALLNYLKEVGSL